MSLLQTIRVGRNLFSLTEKLPKNRYHRNNSNGSQLESDSRHFDQRSSSFKRASQLPDLKSRMSSPSRVSNIDLSPVKESHSRVSHMSPIGSPSKHSNYPDDRSKESRLGRASPRNMELASPSVADL